MDCIASLANPLLVAGAQAAQSPDASMVELFRQRRQVVAKSKTACAGTQTAAKATKINLPLLYHAG